MLTIHDSSVIMINCQKDDFVGCWHNTVDNGSAGGRAGIYKFYGASFVFGKGLDDACGMWMKSGAYGSQT